jgi:hypothetical protein
MRNTRPRGAALYDAINLLTSDHGARDESSLPERGDSPGNCKRGIPITARATTV